MDNYEKYRGYIEEHIENVNKVWDEFSQVYQETKPIPGEILREINYNIANHDVSKYDDIEFQAYADYFFGNQEKTDEIQRDFDYAWNHHQKNNPHHWEYWLFYTNRSVKPLQMPLIYVVEMLCDWGAMSLKFGDMPSDFYFKNKSNMLLHTETRKHVEWLLDDFDNSISRIRKKSNNEQK